MAKKRLRRYHRDVFFPEWFHESLESFVGQVTSRGSVTFSLHALEKVIEYSFEYGRTLFKFLLRSVRRNSLEENNVFEFYANGIDIRKACFRYSFDGFPVDLVLVISSDGTVITVFVINKGDNHNTLDKTLYERS